MAARRAEQHEQVLKQVLHALAIDLDLILWNQVWIRSVHLSDG